MKIVEFAEKYCDSSRLIECTVRRWIAERRVNDFLGAQIMAGVTISDLMIGDGLVDTISPEVKEAFHNLMGSGFETRDQIKELILEKMERGNDSVRGLMNKIQGQLGEDIFKGMMGRTAQLAESGSQSDWDIRLLRDERLTLVQVKAYDHANDVPLDYYKSRVESGQVRDGNIVADHLDIAVPSDIYEQVRERAIELNYPGMIRNLPLTHDDIRKLLEESVDNVQEGLTHFFQELCGDICQPAALHVAVNAFLLYKGAKEFDQAVEDTVYSSMVSAGGITVAAAMERSLGRTLLALQLEEAAAVFAGPVGGALLLAAGMTTRAILKRLTDRRFVVDRLHVGNETLVLLTARVAAV